MTPGDWVGIVKDLLVAGAAVAVAIIAWKGLAAWRRELHGKARFEVARQMLRATYKVRDAVHYVRDPIMTDTEQILGLREGGRSDVEISRIVKEDSTTASQAGHSLRWKAVSEAISELQAAQFEAEVFWDRVKEATKPLNACLLELRGAVEMHYADRRENFLSAEDRQKNRKVICANLGGNEDEFADKLKRAVSSVEALLWKEVRALV